MCKNLFLFFFVVAFSNVGYPVQKTEVRDSLDYYISQSQYLKGLKNAKALSEYYLSKKRYFSFSKTTVRKADIFTTLNDHGKALKVLFNALKIVQTKGEIEGEVILRNKIGSIYQRLEQFEQAKKHFYSGISKAKNLKNDSLVGVLSQAIYKIYAASKHDSAFYYLKQTLEYGKKLGTARAMSTTYNNHFAYFMSNNNSKLAKTYIDSSLYYARKSKNRELISVALSNLVYYQMMVEKDYPKAKETYREIFALTPNDTLSVGAGEIYLNYSYLLEQLHEYKEANHYIDKALDIQSAAFDEQTARTIREVEIRYQIAKVEDEYELKEKQLEAKQSRNRKIIYVIAAAFILTIILLYFFFQNARLKEKNKIKDIESKIQQNIINATIDAQESERKKIAHVLHDNVSAMLSSAGLHLSAFVAGHPEPSEEIAKTRIILKETHDKVRHLSHELVPVLLAKFGLYYALKDLCEKYSNSVIKFDCEIPTDKKKRYHEDFEMKMYFISCELVNNVIKHSEATNARLNVEETNGELAIIITDNGKGFDTSKSQFNEGFGLTQIRARVSNMNGELIINSKPNVATTITIRVPVPD